MRGKFARDGNWFKVEDVTTLILRAQEYFLVDLGELLNKVVEDKKYIKIGKATEKAFKTRDCDISFIDESKKIPHQILNSIDKLLEWAESEDDMTKSELLKKAMQICDDEDRSTEYMIQFMQDYADVGFDEVIRFLKSESEEE